MSDDDFRSFSYSRNKYYSEADGQYIIRAGPEVVTVLRQLLDKPDRYKSQSSSTNTTPVHEIVLSDSFGQRDRIIFT